MLGDCVLLGSELDEYGLEEGVLDMCTSDDVPASMDVLGASVLGASVLDAFVSESARSPETLLEDASVGTD